MLQITSGQVTAPLASLFDFNAPAGLRCRSVLAGADPGKIFTDDPGGPRWGAVWESGDGGLYLGGEWAAIPLNDLITTLKRDGDVVIQFWDGDPIVSRLPRQPEYVGTALEFFDRPEDTADLDAVVEHLPQGCTLRQMDRALFERSLWRDDTLHRHGSVEAFLAKSLAVYLMHGDVMLCEASTGPSIDGVRELGVITHAQHRRRGLATVACACLIQLCAQVGDRTYWNCATDNVASAAVARKLGYRTERKYQLVAWLKSTNGPPA